MSHEIGSSNRPEFTAPGEAFAPGPGQFPNFAENSAVNYSLKGGVPQQLMATRTMRFLELPPNWVAVNCR